MGIFAIMLEGNNVTDRIVGYSGVRNVRMSPIIIWIFDPYYILNLSILHIPEESCIDDIISYLYVKTNDFMIRIPDASDLGMRPNLFWSHP